MDSTQSKDQETSTSGNSNLNGRVNCCTNNRRIILKTTCNEEILFDVRALGCSILLMNLSQQLAITEEEDYIRLSNIDLPLIHLQFILRFLSLHDYNLSNCITKDYVDTQNLSLLLQCPIDLSLFEVLSLDDIAVCLKAASYLQIQQLIDICTTVIAARIYVQYDETSLSEFREAHGLTNLDQGSINFAENFPLNISSDQQKQFQ